MTNGNVLLRVGMLGDGLSGSLMSISRSEAPEPLRLGLADASRGDASLEDSFGVNECERVWTCVGEVLDEVSSSIMGADIDIDTVGNVALRGGEDEGDAFLTLGNG